jgi:putative membrane protein
MVAAGHWSWTWPDPHLPGVPGIPLTNYAGWLLVGICLTAVLDQLVPATPGRVEAVPAALLAWTWVGSTVANLAFFDRPMVALWGGLAMGAVVGPYLVLLRRDGLRSDLSGRRTPVQVDAPRIEAS